MAATAGYYRTVRTTAKGRWYGRRVADIVADLGPAAKVRGDLQRLVAPHDTIEYVLHVHEPAVPELACGAVLHEAPEFVVVNKPSGIPVHPTVNYFQHSVTEKLRPTYGALFPCYRLDRLTSGVLILGRTAEFASRFHQDPKKHKRYLARTRSQNVPSSFTSDVFTEPIVTFNGKRGHAKFLAAWHAAKPATTHVKLVARDAQYAVLECEPVSGRTHQIRKHLALHNMPIHNDEVYADGGLFRNLCRDPSEENFAAVWERAETQRRAKLTGGACSECGSPLYAADVVPLDLHCAAYGFKEETFQAPLPW